MAFGHLLSLVAALVPTWRVIPTRGSIRDVSFKEEWKRKLALASPRRTVARPRAATARELIRICNELQGRFEEVKQIGSIISQLQSKGKEDCLALPLDNYISTLSEAESLSVNVSWLKSRVTALRDLKKESIKRLHVELTSQQEANYALQAQIKGVIAERNSLKKEIGKKGELGALSDPNFPLENFSSLPNIL
ncbi:hypothetical protein CFP56_036513 [Quercus suber]|uniref:Uncharacterized protein n=1 Tax=Quercus suber TaxID=58331 RepID=A0AAW0J709_QUESU